MPLKNPSKDALLCLSFILAKVSIVDSTVSERDKCLRRRLRSSRMKWLWLPLYSWLYNIAKVAQRVKDICSGIGCVGGWNHDYQMALKCGKIKYLLMGASSLLKKKIKYLRRWISLISHSDICELCFFQFSRVGSLSDEFLMSSGQASLH